MAAGHGKPHPGDTSWAGQSRQSRVTAAVVPSAGNHDLPSEKGGGGCWHGGLGDTPGIRMLPAGVLSLLLGQPWFLLCFVPVAGSQATEPGSELAQLD